MPDIDFIRADIEHRRRQVQRLRGEIRQLQHSGISCAKSPGLGGLTKARAAHRRVVQSDVVGARYGYLARQGGLIFPRTFREGQHSARNKILPNALRAARRTVIRWFGFIHYFSSERRK